MPVKSFIPDTNTQGRVKSFVPDMAPPPPPPMPESKPREGNFLGSLAAGATDAASSLLEGMVFRAPEQLYSISQGVGDFVDGVMTAPSGFTGLMGEHNTADPVEPTPRKSVTESLLTDSPVLLPLNLLRGIGNYMGDQQAGLREGLREPSMVGDTVSSQFRANDAAASDANKALQALDPVQIAESVLNPNLLGGGIGAAAPSIGVAIKGGLPGMFVAETGGVANQIAAQEASGAPVSSEDYAASTLMSGIVNSLLEKTGIDRLLGPTGKRGLADIAKASGTEALTEGLQNTNTNLAESLTFNPEQSLTEGLIPSVIGGAGTGAAVRTGANIVDAVQSGGQAAPTPVIQPELPTPQAAPQPAEVTAPQYGGQSVADIIAASLPSSPTATASEIDAVLNSDKPISEIVAPEEQMATLEKEFDLPTTPPERKAEITQLMDKLATVSIKQKNLPIPPAITSTPATPIAVATDDDLALAGTQAATSPFNNIPEPSQAQKQVGNYKKAHVKIHGLNISIENPRGSTRSGNDSEGNPWSVQLRDDYGYIKRTSAADGDQLDVYLGKNPKSTTAYIIDQINPATGKFDEHKTLLGYNSRQEAIEAYNNSFSDGSGPSRVGAFNELPIGEFQTWVRTGSKKPYGTIQKTKRASKKAYKPLSLLQFISSKGGIKDFRGELKSLDISKKYIKGVGRLHRSTGLDLDTARSLAAEAGYGEFNTISEFLDAIDNELRGNKIGASDDIERTLDIMAQRDPGKDRYLIEREADQYGIDPTGKEDHQVLEEIAARAAEEATPVEAEEVASDLIEETYSLLEQDHPEVYNEIVEAGLDDIPFTFEDKNENNPTTANEQGAASQSDNRQTFKRKIYATGQEDVSGEPVQGNAVVTSFIAESAPVQRSEKTSAGEQALVPGVAPVTDRQRIESSMRARKQSSKPQKAADDGLFDVGARSQVDMFSQPSSTSLQTPASKNEVLTDNSLSNAQSEPLSTRAQKVEPLPASTPSDRVRKGEVATSEINLPDPSSMTVEALYRTQKKVERAFIDDNKTPKMSDGEFSALEAYAQKLETEIETRGKQEITDKLQKKKPEAEQTSEVGTGVYTLSEHDSVRKGIEDGIYTAEQIKGIFKRITNSRPTIIDELNALTKDQLTKKYGGARGRNESKRWLVSSAYDSLLSDLLYSEGFSWSPTEETLQAAYSRLINKQTDEDIKRGVARRAESRAKYEESAKQYVSALKDPKTLDDYRIYVRQNGLEKLTDEQLSEYDRLSSESTLEKRKQEKARASVVSGVNANVETDIIETKHTQKGHDLFVVRLGDRVEKDVYNALNATAKRLGGYYSSFRGGGAVPGFQFTTRTAAESFSAASKGETVTAEKGKKPETQAEKLRSVGDRLIEAGEEKLNRDRLTNTHRRATQAAGAEADAAADIAMGKTLKAIAAKIEEGTAGVLGNITAKTEVEALNSIMRQAMAQTNRNKKLSYSEEQKLKGRKFTNEDARNIEYPYPNYRVDSINDIAYFLESKPGFKLLAQHLKKQRDAAIKSTKLDFSVTDPKYIDKIKEAAELYEGKMGWYAETAVANYMRMQRLGITNMPMLRTAIREYSNLLAEKPNADPVKEAERKLIGVKYDGYFPTPMSLAQRMAEELDIKPSHTILEPSAGKGSLIEAAIAAGAKVDNITALEVVGDLRNILTLKGFPVAGRDFMEHDGSYDRVIMNPPFEDGQDMAHVRRAYDMLNDGGRVVAIMSEGPFFRQDKKATEFRDWLDSVGGTSEKLPEGSFKESDRSTGVNTRLVIIDKEASTRFNRKSKPLTNKRVDTSTLIEGENYFYSDTATLGEKQVEIAKGIAEVGRKVFGNGFEFRITDTMADKEGQSVAGAFTFEDGKNIIAIAMGSGDGLGTLHHEGLHFLRRAGAFTPQEWSTLTAKAKREWVEIHNIEKAYRKEFVDMGLTEAQQNEKIYEEAIAEAVRKYAQDGKDSTGILAKIKDFFTGVAAALRKITGKTTAEDILRSITKGQRRVDNTDTKGKAIVAFQKPESFGVFYSAMKRAVQDIKQPKAPVAQWKAIIKNLTQKGVKQEELEWSGVNEWLDAQQGAVTKEALLDYLNTEGSVDVQEVVKGDEVSDEKKRAIAEKLDISFGIDAYDGSLSASELKKQDVPQSLIDDWYGAFMQPENTTKFSQYTLPGGKNYRELLITLPPNYGIKTLPKEAEIVKTPGGFWGVRVGGTQFLGMNENKEKAIAQALEVLNTVLVKTKNTTVFKSSHYDEPNILAHVRFNERTDADGNKVLFVEEIQSDWHQQGRKKGYNQEQITFKDWQKENGSGNESDDLRRYNQYLEMGDPVTGMQSVKTGVLNAPFKKTWHELGMKRILRYAAENGFDKVAWTTGEQQNERYDLSKQVDNIEWFKNADGTYDLIINASSHRRGSIDYKNKTPTQLEDIIGKEPTKRIVDSTGEVFDGRQSGTLEGDGLKVGGSGMKGFYDKILPDFVNKYTKKWGGKVITDTLDAGEYRVEKDYNTSGAGRYRLRQADSSTILSRHKTAEEAWAEAERLGGVSVHSIDITPAMRESVMQGQPMFQRTGQDEPENKSIDKEGIKNLTVTTKNLFAKGGSGIAHIGRVVFRSNDHMLHHIAKEFNSPTVERIRKELYARPGGSAEATASTWEESVNQETISKLNRLGKILQGLTPQQTKRVTYFIQNPALKAENTNSDSKLVGVAAQIALFMEEHRRYLVDRGYKIEDMEGYFPREYLVEKIVENPKQFIADATKAYTISYRDEWIQEFKDKDKIYDKSELDKLVNSRAAEMADDWLGNIQLRDQDINPDDKSLTNTKGVPTPNNLKKRTLSKEVDDILRPYLEQDAQRAIVPMLIRTIRKAEFESRFGAEKWPELRKGMIDDGLNQSAINSVKGAVLSSTYNMSDMKDERVKDVIQTIRTAGYLSFLPRATYSSLTEPLIAGIRTRNVLDSLNSISHTFNAIFKGKNSAEAQAIAEDVLGVVGDVAEDLVMLSRLGIDGKRGISPELQRKFFRATLLTQWTQATKVVSVRIGQAYIKRLAKSYLSEKNRKSTEIFLRELGIPDNRMKDFSEWVVNKGLTLESLTTDNSTGKFVSHERLAKTALRRFTAQVIMEPKAVERQKAAQHPIGNLFYQLQAFSNSFSKNVLLRELSLAGEALNMKKDYNFQERLELFPAVLAHAMLLIVGFGLTELRDEVIFKNPNRKDEFTPLQKFIKLLSRTGYTGSFDPLINAFMGLKYQKKVGEGLLGPTLGMVNDFASAIISLASETNSENTNNTERRAAAMVYDTIVKPVGNAVASMKLPTPVAAPVVQAISHPGTKEAFVSAIAGKKDE